MALQIKTYSGFSKRFNSTKRPTGGTTKNVELKSETNIKSPTFILNTLDFSINYVEAFGNYYYCDVKNLDGNRSELICTMDRPATFKSQMGSYTGYIEYASAAPAGFIYKDDPRNGPTSLVSSLQATETISWSADATGSYVLAMATQMSNGNGGAPAYYIVDASDLAKVVSAIFDSSFIDNIKKQFNGCFDSIISCTWLPFNITWTQTQANCTAIAFYAGNQNLNIGTGAMLRARTWHDRYYCTIPNIGYNGTYIQSSKYMTATIYLPGVGVCPLNYDLYKISATGVTVDVYLDFITGDVVYYLSTASPTGNGQIQSFSGNVAAKVPVVGSSYDGLGVASGVISTAGNIASMNPIGALGGIASIARSLSVDNMIVGANSSPLALIHNKNIVVELHVQTPLHGATDITELDVFRSEQGMPYFDNARISNIPGYIKCRAASVSIPGDGEEQTTINAMMNAGFYYE